MGNAVAVNVLNRIKQLRHQALRLVAARVGFEETVERGTLYPFHHHTPAHRRYLSHLHRLNHPRVTQTY